VQGQGSAAERARLLGGLFSKATAAEQNFLARLLLGELRQGALEGIMLDAIAKAAGLPPAKVRLAAMRAGGLPAVAHAALTDGEAGLARFALKVFHPVQPMLAQGAEDVAERSRAWAQRHSNGSSTGRGAGAQVGRRGARLHAQLNDSPRRFPRSSRPYVRQERAN